MFVKISNGLARVIACCAALALLLAAVLYTSAGEAIFPYLLIVVVWGGFYLLAEAGLLRLAHRARAGRKTLSFCVILRLVIAGAGGALSLLSVGMAARYAISSELQRKLDRATVLDVVRQPGGHEVAFYSSNKPEQPRLIFVHGTPGHGGVFADYLLNPIDGFETIAVDRPGFGRSAGSGPVVSFEEQAKALAPLLVQRQGKWPILIGHSLGGPIVARLAADYPDKVRGVVILAGSLDPDLEAPSWYNDVTSAPVVDLKMPDLYEVSNAEVAAAHEQTRLLATVLDRIRCPVEVVHGKADTLVPVANVDYIKRSLVNCPHIGLTLIEGEGHGIHKSRGAEVRTAIERLTQN